MIEKLFFKISSKKFYLFLFILILTLLSSFNIFHSGIVYSDDINFHMHRILGVADSLRVGKYIPVYFNYLNGFGYGNGLFYPDLFLFIPALFCCLGMNIILSLKIFIILINFFSIYTMYLCVYRISNEKKCAYVSMILYALSNYRFFDFVSRGALGEMLSFVFLPLVVLGLYEIFFGDYKYGYFFCIGLCCLCFSHVISFYLMVIFCILFFLFNLRCLREKNRFFTLIFYILLSMLVTVHFWLPMIEQLFTDSFSISVNSKVFENIIPFYLILFDLPLISADFYYPTGIGLLYFISLFKFKKKIYEKKFVYSIILLGVFSIAFSCVSLFWKFDIFYKVFSVIQFPWRFYMFGSLFFIIGFSLIICDVKFNKYLDYCFIYLFAIFISNVYLYSYNVFLKEPLANEIMMGEYLPSNFNYDVLYNYSNHNIEYSRDGYYLDVSILKNVNDIELPIIYYKGYSACSVDTCYETYKTDNGLLGVFSDNFDDFRVFYYGTPIYRYSLYFSLFGVAILIYKIKKCS